MEIKKDIEIQTGEALKSLPRNLERMMRWFQFDHLPEHLQETSSRFHELAVHITSSLEPGPERTVALRKLLEAKDAAVRAKLEPGG